MQVARMMLEFGIFFQISAQNYFNKRARTVILGDNSKNPAKCLFFLCARLFLQILNYCRQDNSSSMILNSISEFLVRKKVKL